MSDEDNKSVIISIPKKRTYSNKLIVSSIAKKLVTSEQKRECDLKSKRYDLPHEVSLPINKLKKSEMILPFKQYCKQQDKDRFKQRLSISIYDKHKIISTDLRKRLHVDYPLNDAYTVIDKDGDYYKILNVQPLRINHPIYQSLKESINKILQLKHETGIKKDCILNIEINYRNELDIYRLCVKRLTDQAHYFDEFISEDYKKSMEYLTKWDKVKTELELKIKELECLGIEKFTLKSRLIGLQYRYSVQQKYGRFLYYLSPPTWRLNNREFARSIEIEAKGFDYGNVHDEDTFPMIFEKLRKICYGTPIKPVLYFKEPKDLMDLFTAMEKQQLHHYTHVNHLTPYANLFKDDIKSLKKIIFQDYASVANVIKKYENLIHFYEDTCTELEQKFYRILYGLFYQSIATTNVLKLNLHLEFCYEKVFLEKPMNTDIVTVAKAVETFYMDYSKRLDEIKSKTVRQAMVKCEEAEHLKVKKAQRAAKELRLFHRLEHELLQSYDIDANNIYTPIKRDISKNKTIARHRSSFKEIRREKERITLTEFENEYLLLFTDWADNEDPASYLQSLSGRNSTKR